MSLFKDVVSSFRPRCPVCQRGRLFKPWSVSVVESCDACHAPLGQQDVGDGAAVFLIFLLGASIIPMAWAFERLVEPPLWVHVVLWGCVALGMIALILPAVKAYIILLDYRHRGRGG